jgi:acetolactate synthase-1/2/3 large subunit
MLSSMPALAQSLAALTVSDSLPERFAPHLRALRAGYEAFSGPRPSIRVQAGSIDMTQAWLALNDVLPDDVIITNGAGNYTAWAHRYYRYRSYGSQIAPTSGAMGYGLPAAIGAKLAHPKRSVLCLAGDGCFMMSSHELATAVKLALSIVIVVFDNQMYGTIRMHQEKWFPGRVHGTALDNNPDFGALARAYGAQGLQVYSVAELQSAILQGFSAAGPTLIHVLTDPEYISPGATLSSLRQYNAKPV